MLKHAALAAFPTMVEAAGWEPWRDVLHGGTDKCPKGCASCGSKVSRWSDDFIYKTLEG